jgi:serine protease Do
MTSAIATAGEAGQSAGVGFAIPSNMIKSMLPVLIRGGRIVRGMLGVGIQDLTEELAEQLHIREAKGALVSQVAKDSPAARAGLEAGDVVVLYDGKEVPDANRLRKLVAATAPGTRIAVGVIRNGKERTFNVTVGMLPAEATSEAAAPAGQTSDRLAALGLSVQALTPDLAKQFDLQGDKGVLISTVEPGSPAWEANLQAGDLIMEIDRARVTSVGELQRALERAKDRTLLLVKRAGATSYVVLRFK